MFTTSHYFLFQEVELWEACWDGLMEQIYHHLMAGVDVNVLTLFVSDLQLTPCPFQSCVSKTLNEVLGIARRDKYTCYVGQCIDLTSKALHRMQMAADFSLMTGLFKGGVKLFCYGFSGPTIMPVQ